MHDDVVDVTQQWSVNALADLLSSGSEAAAGAAWVAAEPAIYEAFSPEVWTADYTVNPYGPGAHANLYNVETQRPFQAWMKENGVTAEAYAHAVGPIQFISIEIHLNSLLSKARANKGWRIRLMNFPSLSTVAVGLASHYQGTQNHNQMGSASALIRTRALAALTGGRRDHLERLPAATAEDWEERGLMPEPVVKIGSLDISSFDEGLGAKLRFVRNTTVKKELATFFAIEGMSLRDFRQRGAEAVLQLRDIAAELGGNSA